MKLAAFRIDVVATSMGAATLQWLPPTANEDDSPLMNLAGYNVYWGTDPAQYTNSVTIMNPGLATYVVDQLTPATWFFTVTAINAAGMESDYSNVASKVVL
jgi:hypothetical protein